MLSGLPKFGVGGVALGHWTKCLIPIERMVKQSIHARWTCHEDYDG